MNSIAVVAKDAPLRLKPSSKWHVDFAKDYCRMLRSFGEGDQAITLIIDRFGKSQDFRLTLAGKPTRVTSTKAEATIRFGEWEAQKLGFFEGNLGEGVPAMVFNQSVWVRSIAPLQAAQTDAKNPFETNGDAEALTKVSEVFVGSPLRRQVILETGSFVRPFALVDECTDGLLTDWGLDIAQHRGMQQLPKPLTEVAGWLRSSDYPTAMLQKGQAAIVEFRLIVDASGAVESCSIQQSTHPEGFNKAVCSGLQRRAKFAPALDREGKPMRSYYRNRVVFKF